MAYALHWEYNIQHGPLFACFCSVFLIFIYESMPGSCVHFNPIIMYQKYILLYFLWLQYYWFFTFFLPLTLFYACLHLYVIFAISSTCQPATFSPLLPFNPTLLNNVMRLGSVTWSITPPGVPGILNSHRLTLPTTVLCRIYFYCTAP